MFIKCDVNLSCILSAVTMFVRLVRSQIKAQMKRKAYIDAGLVKQDKSMSPSKKITSKLTTPPAKIEPPVKKQKTAGEKKLKDL